MDDQSTPILYSQYRANPPNLGLRVKVLDILWI